MIYVTTIGEKEYLVEILDDHHVLVNGVQYQVDFDSIGEEAVFSLLVDGRSYEAFVFPNEDTIQVLLHGYLFGVLVEDEREKRLKAAGSKRVMDRSEYHLKSPMPGLIVAIPVEDGQSVKKGDVLVVLESMKMQNELKSPRDGAVSRLRVKQGDNVEQRQILLTVL
jgi:biotin carboxyl carrier protein